MNVKKVVMLIPVALMAIGVAEAKGEHFYKVPFHNVEVKAASKIHADYSFGSHSQVLVCKTEPSAEAITSIEWTYKDATRKIDLPVKLKDDERVKDGYFADPDGRLVITNEFGSSDSGSIFVSCNYQNIA